CFSMMTIRSPALSKNSWPTWPYTKRWRDTS
ncbi:uncharacterized protein METZ01_LOCUS515594, partial [marine metagenome]